MEAEAPPIPCHVHAGEVSGGRCVGHGKTEAYFFPPLDIPPYNLQLGRVKTRLGLRPGVTQEQVSQRGSVVHWVTAILSIFPLGYVYLQLSKTTLNLMMVLVVSIV